MSKRRASVGRAGRSFPGCLDAEQLATLNDLLENLPQSQSVLRPVLNELYAASEGDIPPHQKPLPTRAATEFKTTVEAAIAMGVDFKEDNESYHLDLRVQHLQNSTQLSEHYAAVINDLKTGDYVSLRRDESFCRTILDLIIIDRLKRLEDQNAFYKLQVSAEVPLSVRVKNANGNYELVNGRADWALGHSPQKNETGTILVVVEAKSIGSANIGMAQLLVYMTAVYEARATLRQNNQSVFGMLSDSRDFHFCHLNENKRFFVTVTLKWSWHKSTILTYIDTILMNAIASTKETTPHKAGNTALEYYPEFLRRQWRFGSAQDDEEIGEDGGEKEELEKNMVDVIMVDGRVVTRKTDYVLYITGTSAQIHTWNGWSELCFVDLTAGNRICSVKNTGFFQIEGYRRMIFGLWEIDGSPDTCTLYLANAEDFDVTQAKSDQVETSAGKAAEGGSLRINDGTHPSSQSRAGPQLSVLADHIGQVIALTNASRLVFLDKKSWVCSVDVQNLHQRIIVIQRHFFVPHDWFAGGEDLRCAITNREIVFGINTGIAVVRGWPDFVDRIELEVVPDAAS